MSEMTTQQKPTLGTISDGTLKTSNLLPIFLDEIERLDVVELDRLAKEYPTWFANIAETSPDYCAETDFDAYCEEHDQEAHELLDALFQTLGGLAPEFCYFGANPGDGADFGFWVSDDSLRDGIHDSEIIAVDTPPSYVLVTSDHGNQTLYSVELKEVW